MGGHSGTLFRDLIPQEFNGFLVCKACARAKSACSGHLSIVFIAEDQQWIYADGEKLIDFLGTSSDLQSNLKLRMFAASGAVEAGGAM